ncbi:hypothetical protein [Sphingomonas sp. VDB2]|uniref:hypothetical protein n=1 Tax=Sphingomonas sp. VDB2 TaxID=3228751 RepID=UPI003A811E71
MDITTQAVAATAPIHLKSATGDLLYSNGDTSKPCRVIVYGPGSEQFAMIESRQTSRVLKRMADNDGKPSAVPPIERNAERAEDLAAITVAFENFTYPPAADKQGAELFQAFYADPKLGYMAQQVMKSVQDWGNFKPGSAGN